MIWFARAGAGPVCARRDQDLFAAGIAVCVADPLAYCGSTLCAAKIHRSMLAKSALVRRQARSLTTWWKRTVVSALWSRRVWVSLAEVSTAAIAALRWRAIACESAVSSTRLE